MAWVLSVVAIVAIPIAAIWAASAASYLEGDAVLVDGEYTSPDLHPGNTEVRKATDRAEGYTALGWLVAAVVSFASIFIFVNVATAAHRTLLAEDPTAFTKYYFLGMSEAESEALVRDGKPVEVGVYSYDGREHKVEVEFRTSPLDSRLVLANPEDRELFHGFPVHVSNQLEWMVTGLAEHKYGITLEVGQVEDLLVPRQLPTAPAQYGTTPVVLTLGDGQFQRIDATLIWDGDEFKLVGATEGGATLTELPEE